MASNKPICKYGSSCYRKNPHHLKSYFHSDSLEEINKTQIHDVDTADQKRKYDDNHTDTDPDTDPDIPSSKRTKLVPSKDSEVQSELSSCTIDILHKSPPAAVLSSHSSHDSAQKQQFVSVPVEDNIYLRKKINELCLVKMPEDFYQFWDFCKETNPQNPSNTLKPLGLVLTGPYDILAGKLQVDQLTWEKSVLHGRHFYDPPEMQTILMDDCDDTGYHIGYYRDAPATDNCFLVSNTTSKGCRITQTGANIFASVKSLIQKPPVKVGNSQLKLIRELDDQLTKKAVSLGIDLFGTVKRETVAKCFNQIGICVPYDKKTLVGYRPLTMRNDQLKSVLNKITNKSLDSAIDDLQELITFTQFANDESDYGMGLELGIDLFCYGDLIFHGKILNILSVVYDLLDRQEFGKIIEQHLKSREKPRFILN